MLYDIIKTNVYFAHNGEIMYDCTKENTPRSEKERYLFLEMPLMDFFLFIIYEIYKMCNLLFHKFIHYISVQTSSRTVTESALFQIRLGRESRFHAATHFYELGRKCKVLTLSPHSGLLPHRIPEEYFYSYFDLTKISFPIKKAEPCISIFPRTALLSRILFLFFIHRTAF